MHVWRLKKIDKVAGGIFHERFFDGFRKAQTIAETCTFPKVTWERDKKFSDVWVGWIAGDDSQFWVVEKIDVL